MSNNKIMAAIKPSFVEISGKKLVIFDMDQYEKLLDMIDVIEAKRILASKREKPVPWNEVRNKIILNRIAEVREKLGITQKELAKKMKIKQSTISRMEKPDSNLTLETLRRITVVLGVTLHQLISEGKGREKKFEAKKREIRN